MDKYFNKNFIKKGYNLTGEQYDILIHLWYRDEQYQQDIAKALCKDKTTVTRLIKNIEALRFVKRISSKKDKRQKLVCLTSSGKTIVKELMNLEQAILQKAQKGGNHKNIAVCKEVLRQINELLSKELNTNA